MATTIAKIIAEALSKSNHCDRIETGTAKSTPTPMNFRNFMKLKEKRCYINVPKYLYLLYIWLDYGYYKVVICRA